MNALSIAIFGSPDQLCCNVLLWVEFVARILPTGGKSLLRSDYFLHYGITCCRGVCSNMIAWFKNSKLLGLSMLNHSGRRPI